jgi:cell fate regulator YaaT (PSP1 superfamily)
MAKEQNLSLNSAKISGACGRLMCCLRYEYDTYLEEAALTPKVDAIVDTPDGEGLVIESSPLKGTVKVTLNKEPNGARLYRREDCVVKGHMKKKKNNDGGDKKAEEKK